MKTRENVIPLRQNTKALPPLPKAPAPFCTDDKLLEAALKMFHVRGLRREAEVGSKEPTLGRRPMAQLDRAWTEYWHRSVQLTGTATALLKQLRRYRLARLEREIVMALLLSLLGLLPEPIKDCAGLLLFLGLPLHKKLPALRALSDDGILITKGLVAINSTHDGLFDRTPQLDTILTEVVLTGRNPAERPWQVNSEEDLYYQLHGLSQLMSQKEGIFQRLAIGILGGNEAIATSRQVQREMARIDTTLRAWPEWKLNTLLQGRSVYEKCILLALLGKELGHLARNDDLYHGGGLARAAASTPNQVSRALRLLGSDRPLASEKLIIPCGGSSEHLSNSPSDLERTEFELNQKAIDILGLASSQRRNQNPHHLALPLEPGRIDSLVLSEQTRKALTLAVTHVRHADKLMSEWGFGEIVPYGHSPVILFSGPPGTGKTLAATALAGEIGKPILMADYAQIEDCYVGQTEKNIVRLFRDASRQGALLFWDEADAIFSERSFATRNWEVRALNVLLQEIERFEHVCILATNRKVALDKALERRITVKIEFDRPGLAQRRLIWQKLLPEKLPLAADVDLDGLSREDLVGGEIKNVVMNAARLALQRGNSEIVTMMDFREAIALERSGQWNSNSLRPIGFDRWAPPDDAPRRHAPAKNE